MRIVTVAFCLALSGCVTMDSTKATQYSTLDLCRIVALGSANGGWTVVDAAGRREAEQEALRRGVDCMNYAQQITAENNAMREAMGASGAQMLQNSGWSSTPQTALGPAAPPPSAGRTVRNTSCTPPVGNSQRCTTTFTDGTSTSVTCTTFANGSTYCQ